MKVRKLLFLLLASTISWSAWAITPACQMQYKLLAGCTDGQSCTLTDIGVGSYMVYDESSYNPSAKIRVTFQPLFSQCTGADLVALRAVLWLPEAAGENVFQFFVEDKAAEHWLAILQMAKSSGTKISVRYTGQSTGQGTPAGWVTPNMIGLGGGL